ncbi:MAG TPA: MliC family protein [Devosia sp.]|nr:MliC family protein [Devosia sp.]
MAFSLNRVVLSVLLLAALVTPGFAQAVQSSLTLSLGGDAEQHNVQYDCGEFGPLSIAYINASPNFLALVPYEDQTLIFTSVLAGSGVRYASGKYEWRTKGTEASLTDLTAETDTPPLATCSEVTNTP